MSSKPLQKFLAISVGIHLLLFLFLNYYLPKPKLRPNRPLSVEVIPLPKPEKPVQPDKQAALSDVSRKVKKETRQKELPRPGADMARLPSLAKPKPTPLPRADKPELPAKPLSPPPPAPKEEVTPAKPAPSPPEEVKAARARPSLMPPLPRPEPSSPPKEPAKKEAEIALPKVARPDEMPVKPEPKESPAIANLPSAPQVGQV